MKRKLASLGVIIVLLAAASGSSQLRADPAQSGTQRQQWLALYKRPDRTPFPDENPFNEAKAALGKQLFYDVRLSGSGRLACVSCHDPRLSWSDGRARALGAGATPLPFRAPTLLNLAWIETYGWTGKFPTLEDVAVAALANPQNMDQRPETLVPRLRAIPGYHDAFEAVFPGKGITEETIKAALATFERTVVSPESPFDRWVAGEEEAVAESAKRGFDLFNGKAGCAACHSGWNFTKGDFHDIGQAAENDIGRGKLFPTSTKLQHAFKVPTLRDVASRGPYMHDGSMKSLPEVIDLYDRGGVDRPSRSELIKPLHLTAGEKADLLAFLGSLSSAPAQFDAPGLPD